MTRLWPTTIVMLTLAGCAAVPSAPPAVRPASRPPVQAGLAEVIGRDARAITALLGTPRLDVREGAARKLQFSGAACVIDAYLYPATGGGEPVATWIDARLPDGADTDRAACVAALKLRPR